MQKQRRQFVTALALAPLLVSREVRAEASELDALPSPQMADAWMKGARARSATAGGLYLFRFADGYYALTKPIQWSPNPGQEHLPEVTVPVGFVTDFASIPRAFWSLLPRDGQYGYAAIIHDYLYWNQSVSKSEADLIFKYAMQDFEVPAPVVSTVFTAVSVAGGGAWRGNAKAKAAGEKRQLRRLPEDPLTRWSEWKKSGDVF